MQRVVLGGAKRVRWGGATGKRGHEAVIPETGARAAISWGDTAVVTLEGDFPFLLAAPCASCSMI